MKMITTLSNGHRIATVVRDEDEVKGFIDKMMNSGLSMAGLVDNSARPESVVFVTVAHIVTIEMES